MSNVIWWIGLAHIVVYAAVGGFILITVATVKVHMWFKVMRRIIEWHVARARWSSRGTFGLTDEEWQRGEPRP